jgi:[FeFe] hydrogenase H-cluster maturation GTPase HydF
MIQTHRGNRTHIVITGRCNTGKSTILNCLTGQMAAIVSDQPGTTADPVSVPFELLPYGPALFYDTAGLDEPGELGLLRRRKSFKIIDKADLVILALDERGLGSQENDLINYLKKLDTPVLAIANKTDIRPLNSEDENRLRQLGIKTVQISLKEKIVPAFLRETILALMPAPETEKSLVADIVPPHGLVVCVIPIDSSAPKGRLILPQVQLLRELTDHNMLAMTTQPATLTAALERLNAQPDLVVTDSQTVLEVARALPPTIPMTTFSLLFARLKGDFKLQLEGAQVINSLRPGDHVLIAEACSHHAQEDDIAKVKIPRLLEKYVGGPLNVAFTTGGDFPDDLERFRLVVHCGSCMLTQRETLRRLKRCVIADIPVTNYGMAISFCQGVLERAAAPILARTGL